MKDSFEGCSGNSKDLDEEYDFSENELVNSITLKNEDFDIREEQ